MPKLELTEKYKPYKEYKDSGVDWLGKVPKSWDLKPLRAVLKERKEKNKKLVSDNILSVMKDVGVIRYADKGDIGNKSSSRPENYKIVYEGDIVVNSMNLVIGSVGQSSEMGVTSSVYLIYYPKNSEVNASFYSYLFRSKSFQKHMSRFGKGIMELREAIKPIDLKVQSLPLPDLETQGKIVSFLDEKTSAIDAVIEKRERQIGLLKERRAAVITRYVTLGVTTNRKFVTGKSKWVEKVPEDWEVKRLKFLGKTIIGLTYSPENITQEGGTLVLRASNLKDGKVVSADDVYVDKPIPEKLRTQVGDILICARSGSRDLVGKCGLVGKDFEGVSFGAFMTVFRGDASEYIYYYMMSDLYLSQLSSTFTSTINQLTSYYLNNIEVLLPPADERKKIIAAIQREVDSIDALIEKTQSSVELLKEFKTSLISHAVTGKIKI